MQRYNCLRRYCGLLFLPGFVYVLGVLAGQLLIAYPSVSSQQLAWHALHRYAQLHRLRADVTGATCVVSALRAFDGSAFMPALIMGVAGQGNGRYKRGRC